MIGVPGHVFFPFENAIFETPTELFGREIDSVTLLSFANFKQTSLKAFHLPFYALSRLLSFLTKQPW